VTGKLVFEVADPSERPFELRVYPSPLVLDLLDPICARRVLNPEREPRPPNPEDAGRSTPPTGQPPPSPPPAPERPVLEADQGSVNFRLVPEGELVDQELSIRNTGTGPAFLTSVGVAETEQFTVSVVGVDPETGPEVLYDPDGDGLEGLAPGRSFVIDVQYRSDSPADRRHKRPHPSTRKLTYYLPTATLPPEQRRRAPSPPLRRAGGRVPPGHRRGPQRAAWGRALIRPIPPSEQGEAVGKARVTLLTRHPDAPLEAAWLWSEGSAKPG
jgi:hypothetical protein